jgi:hypothetical protein
VNRVLCEDEQFQKQRAHDKGRRGSVGPPARSDKDDDDVQGLSFANLRLVYEDLLAFVSIETLAEEIVATAIAAAGAGSPASYGADPPAEGGLRCGPGALPAASMGMQEGTFLELLEKKCLVPPASMAAHRASLCDFFGAVHLDAVQDARSALGNVCDAALERAAPPGGDVLLGDRGHRDAKILQAAEKRARVALQGGSPARKQLADIGTRAYCGHWIAALLVPCCLDKDNLKQRAKVLVLIEAARFQAPWRVAGGRGATVRLAVVRPRPPVRYARTHSRAL